MKLYKFDWYILKKERDIFSFFINLLKNELTSEQVLLYNNQRNLGNFILNLEKLLYDKQSTNTEKLIYLDLAFSRDYFLYSTLGITTLPIEICLCKKYSLKKLNNNPLLKIEKGKIKFKYE